ncbi:MAG: TolC family protein, partial [Clostridiales bacterium]|nr:TolC family protein [Clostridiales bacterium]
MKIKLTLICISMFAGILLSAETLTLEECVDIARSNNPGIQQTELSAEIGKSKVRQAYSAVMPNVSVSSGLSSSDATAWALGSSYGLSAGMTLYSPGMYSGIQSANLNSKANRLNSINNKNDVVSQVSTLYYRILSTKRLIEVYEGNIVVAEENLKKTRSMYEQNVITISDVLKSEAQKGDFESQLLQQKQLYVSYLRTMNVLLGRDSRMEFDVVDVDVENVDIPEYEDARNMMLKDNPQFGSAILQEKVSKVLVNVSKEAFLPSVSGSYNHNGSYDPAVSARNSVALTASWTLFNGLSRRENIQQSKMRLEQAEINVDNIIRLLDQQLSDYYTQFETYTAMVDINERRLKSAQRAFEIVNQQYELGKATILDRMQAQVTVLSAESTLVE